jgi:D-glycero-D-manno-heptose 1,7-bisphosphate phosphatase
MARAVFLDRDGTLNEEVGYIRHVPDLHLIPGAAQAVKRLNEAGLLAILTTNQTGPARGYYDEAHVQALNARLVSLLEIEAGAKLDAVYYCPHLETGSVAPYNIACTCRKPGPGMVEQACQAFPQIDVVQSFIIGDKATDIEFAHTVGARGVLLKTGYGQAVLDGTYQALGVEPAFICDNIVEAVDWILRETQP